MEKKFRILLMSALLVSLIIVTYYIVFNSFIEMFDLKLRDTLAILSSIFSLFGIIIAASVAIYVMNSNHREAMRMEERRIKLQEEIEERQVVSTLTHTLFLTRPLSKSFEPNTEFKDKDIKFIEAQLDILEKNCSDLISFSKNRNIGKYANTLNLSILIMTNCKSIRISLIKDEIDIEKCKKCAEEMFEMTVKVLNTSEFFLYKDEINKILDN